MSSKLDNSVLYDSVSPDVLAQTTNTLSQVNKEKGLRGIKSRFSGTQLVKHSSHVAKDFDISSEAAMEQESTKSLKSR